MAAEAISAAENVHTQLAGLYPGASAARLWAMEGITLMPGIDDYPGKTEITSPSNAQQVLASLATTAWPCCPPADNGGCPGTVGASTCSGISQNTWDFSHLLERFTS
jgi:hypothetical protein